MSVVQLRKEIIDMVNFIDDESILEEFYNLIRIESGIYQLTEAESKAIQEGLDDSKHGRVYSFEEANQLLQEWRKKSY